MGIIIGFSSIGLLVIFQIVFFAIGYGKLSQKVDGHTKAINGNESDNRETHKEIFKGIKELERNKMDK